MKTISTLTLGVFLFLLISTSGIAQEAPVLFKHQDSLKTELNRFNMQMTDFPTNDVCGRTGLGPIQVSKVIPEERELQTGFIYGDTNTHYGKTDNDVNIYWIHGLNGNTTTWQVPARATEIGIPELGFPARKAVSHNLSGIGVDNQAFDEYSGIALAAGDLRNQALNIVQPHTDKDFIIAHSEGGIVAREWLRQIDKQPNIYPNQAHGLVTFGTPHSGAAIINNVNPHMGDKLTPWLQDACQSLSGPKVNEFFNDHWWLRFLIKRKDLGALKDMACKDLMSFVSGKLQASLLKPNTNDFYVGSPFLTGTSHWYNMSHLEGLSDHKLNVPFVQVYGVEEEPILWRYMSSTNDLDDDDFYHHVATPFNHDHDETLMNKVNGMISDLQARYDYELNMHVYWSNAYNPYLFFYDPLLFAAKEAERRHALNEKEANMEAYYKSLLWLRNANEYYKSEIIGSTYIAKTDLYCMEENSEVCVDSHARPKNSYSMNKNKINSPSECSSYSTSSQHNYYEGGEYYKCIKSYSKSVFYDNTYADKPNDGLILQESAAAPILYQNGNSSNTYKQVHLKNMNHHQMLNSKPTKDFLNELYDGKHGKFFIVDPR